GLRARVSTWPPLRLTRLRCERGSVGVVCPPVLPRQARGREDGMRRCIGLDVHREFAQVAIWEDGVVRQAGRIELTPEGLRDFAASLCASDEVAIEATGNTHAIARLLERHVGRVVVSNPQKTRAIAEAKVKTDKVDAAVLAGGLAGAVPPAGGLALPHNAAGGLGGLLAPGSRPGVWLPDAQTPALRPQVPRRAHIVRQRTRLKNQVQ